jgi:hypothetical protein
MIAGVMTVADFKSKAPEDPVLGPQKLITLILESLDNAHKAPEKDRADALMLVLKRCVTFKRVHGYTQSGRAKEKITPNRIAVEKLQEDINRKIPDLVDPRKLKERAAFHQELLAKTAGMVGKQHEDDSDDDDDEPPPYSVQQMGYLVANHVLKIHDSIKEKEKCRVEAIRIISTLLGKNRELVKTFGEKGTNIEVIVVPAHLPMTGLPEFAKLKDKRIDQNANVRSWDTTRGAGSVKVDKKIYVAITEENLLGTKTTAVSKGGCYAAEYSTTAHEFSHTLHRHILSPAQKKVIADAFAEKTMGVKLDLSAKPPVLLVDPKAKATIAKGAAELDKVFSLEWVDGPRRKVAKPAQPMKYRVLLASDKSPIKWAQTDAIYESAFELADCYACTNDEEYFAQLVCCFLGTNGGTDPWTKAKRQNDPAWIKANEGEAMNRLLNELFSAGAGGYGAAALEKTNVAKVDAITVAEVIVDPSGAQKRLDMIKKK